MGCPSLVAGSAFLWLPSVKRFTELPDSCCFSDPRTPAGINKLFNALKPERTSSQGLVSLLSYPIVQEPA